MNSLVQERKGKLRKLESGEPVKVGGGDEDEPRRPSTSSGVMSTGAGTGASASPPEKKVRKKWTMEETQMLVEGCNRVCPSLSLFNHTSC